MQTRALQTNAGTLLVRPLQRGDVRTVAAVFQRLGDASRRRRFNGPKPSLRMEELQQLAAVDAQHHALVGYLEHDPRPVAIARLVRNGASAEIAFEVADEYQQRGIGSALAGELIADARAAGITGVTALVAADNQAALALLRRTLGRLATTFEGHDYWISASVAVATT